MRRSSPATPASIRGNASSIAATIRFCSGEGRQGYREVAHLAKVEARTPTPAICGAAAARTCGDSSANIRYLRVDQTIGPQPKAVRLNYRSAELRRNHTDTRQDVTHRRDQDIACLCIVTTQELISVIRDKCLVPVIESTIADVLKPNEP